jgi:A/G-specific adenine glycosylase
MRLLALPGKADTKQDQRVNEFLLKVLPVKGVGDFNQALMELGALVCRNKEPLCNLCPCFKYCKAYKQGIQEIIPVPQQKVIRDIQAVIAIIKEGERYYMQKRPAKGLLADLWEFPGGKIEKGETKTQALARELKEELGASLKSARYLFEVKHFYTQFKVNLSVFVCALENAPHVDATHKWVKYKDFSKYPMPSASSKIIDKL